MKNDVMNQLSASRPDQLDPLPDPNRRDRQLHAAFAQPIERRSTTRRTVVRAGIGFGVATGLAGAVAVAVLATGSISRQPANHHPSGGHQRPVVRAGHSARRG
ncbi:hypothetical protein [Fodinicola feengrottensis]|uniref:hypothetical protein n=1 Tax=Fodinicola feengrottensis TaxID=435914 RepID=UPI0013D29F9A|nr:hypothetical protein [Fodinicola feengrottensis]